MGNKYERRYEHLLPEYYPIKLIGAFISVDFIVGCSFNCSFCISKRHESREELFEEGLTLNNFVTPKKMYNWLRIMPSYQAGVQIRIGHDTDAGLEFEKSSQLIDLIDDGQSITYLTRKPLTEEEATFFSRYRENLLLKLTATPRSESLGVKRNPLNLVHSASSLDKRTAYWIIGPIVDDNQKDAEMIIESLPKGSRLFLKELNYSGLPHLSAVQPISSYDYHRIEKIAVNNGHIVTEFFCDSLARLGQGFFDSDKIKMQQDSEKKERELGYCRECPSHRICNDEIDTHDFRVQLDQQLKSLELTLLEEPVRIGPRSFEIKIKEPSSRGEETYLNHAIDPPVSININTREQGRSQGGSFCNIDREVLRRWYDIGFFPVGELNNIAEYVLRDVRQMFTEQGRTPKHFNKRLLEAAR